MNAYTYTGKYFFATGSVYDGQWADDSFGGRGVFKFQNGDVYKGYFEHHKMSKTGTYIWKTGNVYTGQWLKGKMHGVSECKYQVCQMHNACE